MSRSYSSLDWVLSHWVHFTVHSLDLVVFLCVFCVFFHTAYMLCYCQHSGVDSFDPKPVPDMTYNMFGGTLNLAQLQPISVIVKHLGFRKTVCGNLIISL